MKLIFKLILQEYIVKLISYSLPLFPNHQFEKEIQNMKLILRYMPLYSVHYS